LAANGHGGARAGAGRKRSSVRELLDAAAVAAERQITDHMPKLIANMLVLADGVSVEKPVGDGETIVYTQPPDRAANEYLINRVMGKPTEKTEADVSVSGGVQIFLPERKAD
jgi:hypothetical protein